jgi:hypothetical protein
MKKTLLSIALALTITLGFSAPPDFGAYVMLKESSQFRKLVKQELNEIAQGIYISNINQSSVTERANFALAKAILYSDENSAIMNYLYNYIVTSTIITAPNNTENSRSEFITYFNSNFNQIAGNP